MKEILTVQAAKNFFVETLKQRGFLDCQIRVPGDINIEETNHGYEIYDKGDVIAFVSKDREFIEGDEYVDWQIEHDLV